MSYILMDVGGTQIKACAVGADGARLGALQYFDSVSGGGKDEIFRNFAGIIRSLAGRLPPAEQTLRGVGMTFPGPFDYEKGVCYIRGLGKYDSLYGCDIRRELRMRLPGLLPEKSPILFRHDVEAFAVGEYACGEAAGSRRTLLLCIGTGAGSAFMRDGAVLRKAEPGVPENGWIYSTPFREGIIDDYVSARGLAAVAARFFGKPPAGAELDTLCERGDKRALAAYGEFGDCVLEATAPFLASFGPDLLVLGGQISKGFIYFGSALRDFCDRRHIRVALCPDTSRMALQGLLAALRRLEYTSTEGL